MTDSENTTNPEENQLVPKDHFSTLREQINNLKSENKKFVFDYETKKGEAQARSHVAKLRKTNPIIDSVHKEAKEESLRKGQKLDADKRELKAEVAEMVAYHMEPLNAKKARLEKEAGEKLALERHEEALHMHDLFKREEALKIAEEKAAKEKAEAEAKAEKERLEKERVERERKLKEEAAENARIEAEQKAKAAKEESERKEREATEAKQRAEREAEEAKIRAKVEAENAEKKRIADIKAAEEKAAKDKQAAILEEQKKQAQKEADAKAEQERLAKAEAVKKANVEHRSRVKNEAFDSLREMGIDRDTAVKVVAEIEKGNVKNITINY